MSLSLMCHMSCVTFVHKVTLFDDRGAGVAEEREILFREIKNDVSNGKVCRHFAKEIFFDKFTAVKSDSATLKSSPETITNRICVPLSLRPPPLYILFEIVPIK